METVLIIGIGGFIGANMRYFMSEWVAGYFGQKFPWGTLFVNFAGSLLLGAFISWTGNHISIDPRWKLLIGVGFFGAFTTFSTYANQSVALYQNGDWVGAVANVLGTNLICIVGAMIGISFGDRF